METPELEVQLTGGHTPGVVRVGDTVRRPLTSGSEHIHRLLTHFETCRFGGAPRSLGIDARRREILSVTVSRRPTWFWLARRGYGRGAADLVPAQQANVDTGP
jgi:hypothetical protein